MEFIVKAKGKILYSVVKLLKEQLGELPGCLVDIEAGSTPSHVYWKMNAPDYPVWGMYYITTDKIGHRHGHLTIFDKMARRHFPLTPLRFFNSLSPAGKWRIVDEYGHAWRGLDIHSTGWFAGNRVDLTA